MRLRVLIAVAIAVFGSFVLLDLFLSLPYRDSRLLREGTAQEWIRELQNVAEPVCRHRAAEALGQRGEDVVPDVVQCLRHDASQVRSSACLTLFRLGPAAHAAVPDLLRLLQQPTEPARLDAIRALESIGPSAVEAIDVLGEATRDQNPPIRHAATRALGAIGEPAVPTLLGILEVDDPALRRTAVDGLAQTRVSTQIVRDALARMARDVETRVSDSAFAALSALGTEGVAPLESLLVDEDPTTRARAAAAFCRMGTATQHATASLLAALDDPDANVRFWVLRALAGLDLQELPHLDQVTAALQDQDPDVRWQAADTVGRAVHQHPQAVAQLRAALDDENRVVRQQVVTILKRIAGNTGKSQLKYTTF
jgi:HEAT repeat protein